jgi:hypothetical protein
MADIINYAQGRDYPLATTPEVPFQQSTRAENIMARGQAKAMKKIAKAEAFAIKKRARSMY